MKRSSWFAILIVLASFSGRAQSDSDHGLTPPLLKEIEDSFILDSHVRFAQNALAQVDAAKISLNWEKINDYDSFFSHRLKDQKITNQKKTSRCWMFAGLNMLRPAAARNLNVEDIEFSQNYLFFFDKLEKANLFLEAVIRTRENPLTDRTVEFLLKDPVPDGGQWVGMVELVRKYGLVPMERMPETFSSSNSATVNRVLGLRMKEYALRLRRENGAQARQDIKKAALKDVYRILAVNFGVPPKTFRWRYQDKNKKISPWKTYTPQQFYREVVGVDLDGFCALYSIPTRPFEKLYAIDLDKSVYDRPDLTFVNCPIETLKELVRKSLFDNQPVWFGCDVGRESFGEKGLMVPEVFDYSSIYGMDFKLSRKEMFETYSNYPTHAMVFTGIDVVENRVDKWLVENSWGDQFGNKGYFYMMDDWFDDYVQVIVVHKKYIPKSVMDLFQTQPERLPPWDPMYRFVHLP